MADDTQKLAQILRGAKTIYIPGAAGAPLGALPALHGMGADLITSYVAGINDFAPLARCAPQQITSFFGNPALSNLPRGTQHHLVPLSYFEINNFLQQRAGGFTALLLIAPPDKAGNCSLGASGEFAAMLAQSNARLIGIINPDLPAIKGAPSLPASRFEHLFEIPAPIVTQAEGALDEPSRIIADHIASLVPNGATLQTGIGKVPNGLFKALTSHRNLAIHSGIVSSGITHLWDAGALDPSKQVVTASIIGPMEFYHAVKDRTDLHITGARFTHNPAQLSQLENFVAVNSAIEVDLSGQCNAEQIGSRVISGPGGLPDFAFAARRNPSGLSIIALPAANAKGTQSRIVARLSDQVPVTLPRTAVDCVVTEYGIADLRGLSLTARAEALTAIAAPAFRDELASPDQ